MKKSNNNSQHSASSLHHDQLGNQELQNNSGRFLKTTEKNQFQIQQQQIPKSKQKNPFINANHKDGVEESFHFKNQDEQFNFPDYKKQTQNRTSALSFVQKQDSYQFPPQKTNQIHHRQANQFPKKSDEFQFNNNIESGSLFSSQKSDHDSQKHGSISISKNIENYTKLLKQYYNESYLIKTRESGRKTSLIYTSSLRRSQIPYFITRQPISFKKKFEGVRSGYGLSGNYLCKVIENKIYYKNVQNDELSSVDTLKCQCIQLGQKQQISPSIEINSTTNHLFYYSNTNNQIVILSLMKSRKNNEEICRVKTRIMRQNPLLYLISINKQNLLLIIGGYNPIYRHQQKEVQGCKYIEIFNVDKWGKDIITSRLIKLINGKIYPLIVFPVKIEGCDSILLIGGNTMAKKTSSKNQLTFKDYKTINRSSNVRGVYISTKQIIQCLQHNKDIISLPHGNSISVQIQSDINLYCGYVDFIKSNRRQKIRLFLPKIKEFYTMKIIKKQVRIIKSKEFQQRKLSFESTQTYQHLAMKCFKRPTMQYYEINNKGFFQQKHIQLTEMQDSAVKNKTLRCPCQFM